MTDTAQSPLAMLQHADSAFPSGAVSFSWGLEALVNRGAVASTADVETFLHAQLEGRWATIDRVMLLHAHAAENDLERLTRLDALTDAQSLAAEQRSGSRRMGRAFLGVHLRLGTPLAAVLNAAVADERLCGHAPVMQGAVWQQLGFSADQAQQMAAHGLCAGILGAAVRLSVIGHFESQAILSRTRPVIERIFTQGLCPPEAAHGFAPQIEIASMLHETDQMRLFVN